MARPVDYNPEKTVRLNLYGEYNSRDSGVKDQRFINGYLQVVTDKSGGTSHYYYKKRPGSTRSIQPTGAANAFPRGVYQWNNTVFSVYGTNIYAGTTLIYSTMSTSTGIVSFQETRPGAAVQLLSINDGTNLYMISPTNVVTVLTSGGGFPSPNTGELEFFDGYLIVLQNNGQMWTSGFDDPTTWNPANFIDVQMNNGIGVGLARQNNYVVAFTDRQTQFFYDNANPTGSPFNNADTATMQIGLASKGSLFSAESSIFFVSNTQDGQQVVYSLDGATGLSEISNEAVNRSMAAEGANIVNCIGLGIRSKGQYFYILHLLTQTRTWVYNVNNKTWTEWTSTSYNTLWPYISTYQFQHGVMAQHMTDGYIYLIQDNVYQDNAVSFPVKAQLNKRDMDVAKRKWFNRVELIGDIQTAPSPVSIYYTDDDYNTFSTPRVFDMSTRVWFRAAGAARRRAWVVESTTATDIRWECLEVDVMLGDY